MSFISRYIKKYRKEAVLAPMLKLTEATLELFVPLLVAEIIDKGIKGVNGTPDTSYVFISTLKLIILALTGLAASVTAQYFAAKAATGFAAGVRSDLFSHILKFTYKDQDAIGSDTLIARLTSDVLRVQNGVNMTLRLLLRSPFVVLGAMVMAFTVDVKGALIFLAIIPMLSAVIMVLIFLTLPLYRANQEKLDRLLLSIKESLDGVRVIRAFSLEKENGQETTDRNDAVFSASLKAGRISAIQNPLTLVMINIATILLIYTGAVRVDTGFISTGQVVALVNYTAQILVELVKIANMMITLTQAIASGKRITDILGKTPGEKAVRSHIQVSGEDNDGNSYSNGPAAGSVLFENVTFSYHENAEPALSGLSFEINPGEMVGIIGSTGSGKTTLVNLITGAFIPTSGRITVTGDVSVVPQKSVLFSGTVADNLRWGNENADEDDMWKALKEACADEFMREKGLNHEVEAGGKNFSGGQRQRLCIARALIKPANILILDDSASALDYATEKKLRESVEKLPETVFWISQRAASIVNADRILVLDDGKLVGCGRHGELLETCEIYREIFESQN